MRHKDHRAISKLLLGNDFAEVQRWMDAPAYRVGFGHRKYRHDARAVVLMALRHRDARAGVSALLHIGADFTPTEIRKILKKAGK